MELIEILLAVLVAALVFAVASFAVVTLRLVRALETRPAPSFFERIAPSVVAPCRHGLAFAECALCNPEAPIACESCGAPSIDECECDPADFGAEDPLEETLRSVGELAAVVAEVDRSLESGSPSAPSTEAPEPEPASPASAKTTEAPTATKPRLVASKGPEFVCGGAKKRHNYRGSDVEGRCKNCGAPEPGVGQLAAATTPEQAAAWQADRTPPDVQLQPTPTAAKRSSSAAGTVLAGASTPPASPPEPVEDPAGAHITGPSTSKATSSGAIRAARRGGSDDDITIAGEFRGEKQEQEPYWDAQALADGWCPRGHGPMAEQPDEYGDTDRYCITCGFRPTRAPEPGETGPAPGKSRRREPSINGMRI